jgi:hypothetical protein
MYEYAAGTWSLPLSLRLSFLSGAAARDLHHRGRKLFANTMIPNNFVTNFAFAANVFFVFLVLHFMQWLR